VAALGDPERARTLLPPRVADHLGAFEKLYADKGQSYEMRIASEIAVACEAQDLDELLGNLVDNASKWARQRVLVAADRVGTMVEMTIEDESAPGYGFGLPITRRAG
jgi:signal transduction histidine kinase